MFGNRRETHSYYREFLGRLIPDLNVCSNEILTQITYKQVDTVPLRSIPQVKLPYVPEWTDAKSMRERCIRNPEK